MSADFIDSNVLLYLFDPVAHEKRRRAEALLRAGLESRSACISFQVVQETLNVMTRKMAATVTPDHARDFLSRVLMRLWRVMPSQALYAGAIGIQQRYGFGFYDSLIVAAALEAGCTRLLSEDLQDGQLIDTLRIENPFKALA